MLGQTDKNIIDKTNYDSAYESDSLRRILKDNDYYKGEEK